MMKILHINKSDIKGGAAKAAYRLHTSLIENGVESKILVERKYSSDKNVIRPSSFLSQIKFKLQGILEKLVYKFYKADSLTPFSSNLFTFNIILEHIERENPDIVHFHWIGGNMIAINHIYKIKQPIVWSLHDNWAFTGGCHISWECEKYKDNCGACPRINSQIEDDLSKKIFKIKQKAYNKKNNLYLIGLSKWITECSKQSTLFKNKKNINLPNLIDTFKFKPVNKEASRELWNFSHNKNLILFGAVNATSDINKGFKQLNEALAQLEKNQDIELVIFGSDRPENEPDFKFATHYLGNLTDDISLITLYNAVDVIVVPSLQENLSNTIMESLSCGLPVVAFDIGGNSEMIIHKKNGYLAKPYVSTDLASGIEWIINNSEYTCLCENAREKVSKEFSKEIVVKKYIELYNEVLNG